MQAKKILLIALTFLALIATASAATCPSIEQYEITWTFAEPFPECGTFANGDYWVVPNQAGGNVEIVEIEPASFVGDGTRTFEGWTPQTGRIVNGSMINPDPTVLEVAYDSEFRHERYNPELNEARPDGEDLSTTNRLRVPAGSSLISSISLNHNDYYFVNNKTQLRTAAILTVLESVPSDTVDGKSGFFRPAYTGNDKALKFHKNDLDYTVLKRLPITAEIAEAANSHYNNGSLYDLYGNVSNLSEAMAANERNFERPWIQHYPDWTGDEIMPIDNTDHYGQDKAYRVGAASLMLNLDFENTEKETLLVRFVQLGIDLYGIYEAGGTRHWVANGGHNQGRKWPILFTGIVMPNNSNAQPLKNIGSISLDAAGFGGEGYVSFGEDEQTFYVAQINYDVTHANYDYHGLSIPWADPGNLCDTTSNPNNCRNLVGPDRRDLVDIPYEISDFGMPEWGIRNWRPGSMHNSNKFWRTWYRGHQTNPSFAGFVLAAHIMDAKELWNHDALFDYMDRHIEVEKSVRQRLENNPGQDIVYSGVTFESGWSWLNLPPRFIRIVWDEYRADYGCTWTRDNDDIYSNGTPDCSQCIYNCSGDQECVDITTLLGYIQEWKQGSLGMLSLMQKLEKWKAGTGC